MPCGENEMFKELSMPSIISLIENTSSFSCPTSILTELSEQVKETLS